MDLGRWPIDYGLWPMAYGLWTMDYGLIRCHVRRVDFHADSLADQLDRNHEARVRALAHETADDAFQRAVLHLDHHAFANHRAGVVLQIAFDEPADAVDLVLGN